MKSDEIKLIEDAKNLLTDLANENKTLKKEVEYYKNKYTLLINEIVNFFENRDKLKDGFLENIKNSHEELLKHNAELLDNKSNKKYFCENCKNEVDLDNDAYIDKDGDTTLPLL